MGAGKVLSGRRVKTNQKYTIPVTPKLEGFINKLGPLPWQPFVDDNLVVYYNGKSSKYMMLTKHIKRSLSKDIGWDEDFTLSPHRLRHTFAIRQLNHFGFSLMVVARMLRDTEQTVRKNYADYNDDFIARTFNKEMKSMAIMVNRGSYDVDLTETISCFNWEQITLEKANLIIQNSIKKAREIKINPIMVVILDHRGAIKACLGEDGISSLRFKIAHGKANGAFQMGMGSRALFNRAEQQAYFINAVNALTNGELVPVPGGVLIRDKNNNIIGSVGISGDTSDNDEIAAVFGIEAAGFKPDIG